MYVIRSSRDAELQFAAFTLGCSTKADVISQVATCGVTPMACTTSMTAPKSICPFSTSLKPYLYTGSETRVFRSHNT